MLLKKFKTTQKQKDKRMKDIIELKGKINVDKSEMKEILAAGSCGQSGIACRSKVASSTQTELGAVVIVDELKWT